MTRRRLLVGVVVACAAVTTACGNEESPGYGGLASSSEVSTTAAMTQRRPLSFRPVLGVKPSESCDGTPDDDARLVAAIENQRCYVLGDGVTFTRYGAEPDRDETARYPKVTVTLADGDLATFNGLARICFEKQPACPTKTIAIVFADRVQSAPAVMEPEFSNEISVIGPGAEELLQ
jgi:hypothetical protein